MGAERFAVEGRGPGPAMRKRLAGFVVTLRDAGFVIGQAEAQDAARLIVSPMAERPDRLRVAMRTLFVSRRTEIGRFDELFDAFWRGRGVKRAVKIDAEAVAARSPRRFQHGPNADERRQEPTHIGGAPLPKALPPMGAGDMEARRRRRQCPGRTSRRSSARGSAPKPPSSPNGLRGSCGRGSPVASARAGGAEDSTCARRSGSASPMAASRSNSNSAGARSSRSDSSRF